MRSPNATTRPRRGNANGSGPGFAAEAKPHRTAAEAPDAIEPLLSVLDVASRLRVGRRTLERLRSSGAFPPPDLYIGRSPRWLRSSLVAWIAKGGGR